MDTRREILRGMDIGRGMMLVKWKGMRIMMLMMMYSSG